jgi:hypothetical protein
MLKYKYALELKLETQMCSRFMCSSTQNVLVFWERTPTPSYFPHKSVICWDNGTEDKIGTSEAPQNILECMGEHTYTLLPEMQI